MLKPKDQTRVTSDRQWKHTTIQKMRTDLAWEGCPVQRLYKVCVHLVGPHNDGGHGLLVLQGRGGQKRESGQGDVVLDTGQAALIVAIWTQAAQKTVRNTQGEGHRWQLKLFQINTLNPDHVMINSAWNVQGSVPSYLDTREKASVQMAGQGTKRMAMRPNAAG